MQPLLTIEHLDAGYGGKTVISGINITLSEGEILGIVGESGSGKSTLLKSISHLKGLTADVHKGRVTFEGKDLLSMSKAARRTLRGDEISYIFQNPGDSLNPTRKVRVQFYETIRAHRQMAESDMDELCASIFRRIGLTDVERILDAYPFELSGGMAQRVVIALAVLLHPKLILADEPTSALDTTVQKQVIEELLMLRKTLGTAIMVVTHNIGVVRKLADTVAVMYKGEIVEYGKKEDVLSHPSHPYTISLLAAVPKLAWQRDKGKEASYG